MLVNESYIRGLRFKVYLDGTVVTINSRQELGYIPQELVAKLKNHSYDRICIDELVTENLRIPAMLQTKISDFFRNFKNSIIKKPFVPKKKCLVTLKEIKKYSRELPELQRIVLYRVYFLRESGLTISQRLGINKTYVYKVKSDGIKNIVSLRDC